MTGFTAFLLEQGIETQLPINLNETLGLLEETVSTFALTGTATCSPPSAAASSALAGSWRSR